MATPVVLQDAGRRRVTSMAGRDTWPRFRRNRVALAALAMMALLILLAVAAPLLTAVHLMADPNELDTYHPNAAYSLAHPLGTDGLGRDLLSRTVYGGRVSLSIAILVGIITLTIGGTIGLIAGYAGGRVDNLLMRLTDLMLAFPDLLFVLVIASVLGPGYRNILIAVAAVQWTFMARLVRGEVLSIREREYVDAARASGAGPARIIIRHIAPNAVGPVIVTLAFGVPAVIFTEAFLSFIGVGLSPPTPSWGVLVREGYEAIYAHANQVLAPAVAIAVTALSFNFVGDGLRDALDPRLRG